MVPERTRKCRTDNLLALADIGQLTPGAVYFDSDLLSFYGATSNTELTSLAGAPVTEYGGIGISFEETAKPAANGAYSLILPYSMTIPADCSGSSFYNKTNPSAQVVVSIKQNGTEFATLTVSSGGSPTWSASETVLAAGDRVSFVFPSQDSTWAGVVITLRGMRV